SRPTLLGPFGVSPAGRLFFCLPRAVSLVVAPPGMGQYAPAVAGGELPRPALRGELGHVAAEPDSADSLPIEDRAPGVSITHRNSLMQSRRCGRDRHIKNVALLQLHDGGTAIHSVT